MDLIAIRDGKCWTTRDLAREAGCAHESVRRVEAGAIATPRLQFALARAYGVDPHVIVPVGRRTIEDMARRQRRAAGADR